MFEEGLSDFHQPIEAVSLDTIPAQVERPTDQRDKYGFGLWRDDIANLTFRERFTTAIDYRRAAFKLVYWFCGRRLWRMFNLAADHVWELRALFKWQEHGIDVTVPEEGWYDGNDDLSYHSETDSDNGYYEEYYRYGELLQLSID